MAELGLVMSGKSQIFNQIIHQTCNTDILRFRNLRFCTGVLIKLKGFYVPNLFVCLLFNDASTLMGH